MSLLALPRQYPHRMFDYDSFYSPMGMQHIDKMVQLLPLNTPHLWPHFTYAIWKHFVAFSRIVFFEVLFWY